MSARPKVSALMITYNHERYIEQAVRSALMQKTNFDYEIVIGEDCSTDGTREILLRLAGEYPGRLRLLLRERNLGASVNFADAFAACRGDYLAILEGDDYWTDQQKLAKQVAFLDAHPEYAGCAHVVCPLEEQTIGRPFPDPCPGDVTLDDLFVANRFHTCSVVYRRSFTRLPDWHATVLPGDWPLHILHAVRGPFRVFPEAMAVYRVHRGGMWSQARGRWRADQMRHMYGVLIAEMPEHAGALTRARFWVEYGFAHQFARTGDWPAARSAARRLTAGLPNAGLAGLLWVASALAHVLTPTIYRAAAQSWGMQFPLSE